MSKVVPATCTAGVVLADSLPLAGATLFSEGVAQSDGVAIIDEDQVFYFAKISPDVKTFLTGVIDVLTQLTDALSKTAAALTLLDAKPTGGTGSAVVAVAATNVTGIGTANTQITALKTQLNALKGALR